MPEGTPFFCRRADPARRGAAAAGAAGRDAARGADAFLVAHREQGRALRARGAGQAAGGFRPAARARRRGRAARGARGLPGGLRRHARRCSPASASASPVRHDGALVRPGARATRATPWLDFARGHPDNTTLLIDTYDTEAGARKVVELAPRLEARRHRRQGGTARFGRPRRACAQGARHPRRGRLRRRSASSPAAGWTSTTSSSCFGGADRRLRHRHQPGRRRPTRRRLDCAYKLVEYAGIARRKRSEGKANWPGRKQVFRSPEGDLLALESEERHPGTPAAGSGDARRQARRTARAAGDDPRPRARRLRAAAAALRSLRRAEPGYRVEVSDALRALAAEVDRRGT